MHCATKPAERLISQAVLQRGTSVFDRRYITTLPAGATLTRIINACNLVWPGSMYALIRRPYHDVSVQSRASIFVFVIVKLSK